MPRKATVYRIMIASPSDVSAERAAAREVILNWDAANSIDTSIVLEPILWETHANPELGDRPQAIINRQLVETADMLVAIFWARIGSPTGVAPGGTIEEIEQFIASGRPVLLYFSLQNPPYNMDLDQYRQLREYRESCKDRGLYSSYSDVHEFRESLALHLARVAHSLGEATSDREIPYSKKTGPARSRYSFRADGPRLRIQADNLVQLDRRGIQHALSFLRSRGCANPHIVDVGCSDGYVTVSRFGKLQGVTVHGIDIDEECIEIAKRDRQRDGFEYTVGDVESATETIEPCDMIFCGEVLHHLKNPEGAIHRLWGRLRSPGALVVRGSDDGFKLTHPEDADLSWLLRTAKELKGSSDRGHGRKIYAHLRALNPEPAEIKMFYQVDSTVGMSAEERGRFFDDNYAFHLIYAEELLKEPAPSPNDRAFVERFRAVMESQRKRFVERNDLFSFNAQNIGVAGKLAPATGS